jgi:hypothetical protein
MSQPSRRDKLKDQVEASTRGFAFDALIGTLSKPPGIEQAEQPVVKEETAAPEESAESVGEEQESKAGQTSEKTQSPQTKRIPAKRTQVKNTTVENTVVNITTVENTIVEIASNYFRLDMDVSDRLAALQTPAEQAIYNRLYRLSYGEGQNICSVGTTRLVEATGIKSPKTIAQAIKGLVEKGHIAILNNHNNNPKVGTTYRVFLPVEIDGIKSRTKIKSTEV